MDQGEPGPADPVGADDGEGAGDSDRGGDSASQAALSDRTETLAQPGPGLIFELLLGTGIRLGSLVGLNVGDVDLQAGTLHIRTKGGAQERVFLNPVLVRMLGRFLCEKSPHRATVALRCRFFAAGGGHGWDRGRFNCGSPPCAARPASPAASPSTPSATPSPPGCTTRPATCTWSSAPSATGTSRRRRSMRGWGMSTEAGGRRSRVRRAVTRGILRLPEAASIPWWRGYHRALRGKLSGWIDQCQWEYDV